MGYIEGRFALMQLHRTFRRASECCGADVYHPYHIMSSPLSMALRLKCVRCGLFCRFIVEDQDGNYICEQAEEPEDEQCR